MISWKTDTVDLFRFVATSLNDRLDEIFSDQATRNPFRMDTSTIGVGGQALVTCVHSSLVGTQT